MVLNMRILAVLAVIAVLSSTIVHGASASTRNVLSSIPESEDETYRTTKRSGTFIYSNGSFENGWNAWNWEVQNSNKRAPGNPAKSSKYSMCAEILPFGAVSLHGSEPFGLRGGLGIYLRSDSNVTSGIESLELQFEGRGPSGEVHITTSKTILELIQIQAGTDEDTAKKLLFDLISGKWVAVMVDLSTFGDVSSDNGLYYSITLGRCLQKAECTFEIDAIPVCVDHVVLVVD